MTGRFEGKVALITGAARGQGRNLAVRMAREGADVIAIDICRQIDGVPIALATPAELAGTAAAVRALGRQVHAAEVDVRDFDALKAAVDAGVERLGRLDSIIANAGIGNGGPTLDQLDEGHWTDMLDINLGGVWKTIKAGIGHVIAGGRGGSVTLICSVGGLKAYPQMGAYVAAKHGMVGLMRAFAVELAEHHIRSNSVHPTNIDTPMFMNDDVMRGFRPDLDHPGPDDVLEIAKFMHTLPIGWVEPDDVSSAVLYLASDEARYVTGIVLPVDGGSCLK